MIAGSASYGWTFVPNDNTNYQNVEGEITLFVLDVALDHIVAVVPTSSLNYKALEKFDLTNVLVKAINNDASEYVIPSKDVTITYIENDYLQYGDTFVMLSYKEFSYKVEGINVEKINYNVNLTLNDLLIERGEEVTPLNIIGVPTDVDVNFAYVKNNQTIAISNWTNDLSMLERGEYTLVASFVVNDKNYNQLDEIYAKLVVDYSDEERLESVISTLDEMFTSRKLKLDDVLPLSLIKTTINWSSTNTYVKIVKDATHAKFDVEKINEELNVKILMTVTYQNNVDYVEYNLYVDAYKTLEDTNTGIVLEGYTTLENTQLTVVEDTQTKNFTLADSTNYSSIASFDIQLQDSTTGLEIANFQNEIIVKIKVPTDYLENHQNLIVVHYDDENNATLIDATYENGFMVFKTNHFSVYSILCKNFKVTYVYNDGRLNEIVEHPASDALNRPSVPTNKYTVFMNWYSDEALSTPFVFGEKITKDIVVYAKWLTTTTLTSSGVKTEYIKLSDALENSQSGDVIEVVNSTIVDTTLVVKANTTLNVKKGAILNKENSGEIILEKGATLIEPMYFELETNVLMNLIANIKEEHATLQTNEFPFSNYTFHDIMCPVTIKYGAIYKVSPYILNGSGVIEDIEIITPELVTFDKSEGLVILKENASFKKDWQNGVMNVYIEGNADGGLFPSTIVLSDDYSSMVGSYLGVNVKSITLSKYPFKIKENVVVDFKNCSGELNTEIQISGTIKGSSSLMLFKDYEMFVKIENDQIIALGRVRYFAKDLSLIKEEFVEYGFSPLAPIAPTVEGYEFVMWENLPSKVVKNVDVYAKYQGKIISFYVDGTLYKTLEVANGTYTNTLSIDTPQKEGHTFNSWQNLPSQITEDISVNALFDVNSYSVTFNVDGEVYHKIDALEFNKEIIYPKAPLEFVVNDQTYTFNYWYETDENQAFTDVYLPSRNLNLHAAFVKSNSYFLTDPLNPNCIIGLNDEYANQTTIKLPEKINGVKITSLSSDAFMWNETITSVDLSNTSITALEMGSFYGASSLETVILPSTLTSIGMMAFSDCIKLKTIVLPNGLTSIGDNAFTNCEALTSIILPESLTSIGSGAFASCKNITSINFNDANIQTIASSCFSGCESLTEVILPNSVVTIKTNAFLNCKNLTTITLGSSIQVVALDAFRNCTALSKVIYKGSMENFNLIQIDSSNVALINAIKEYQN